MPDVITSITGIGLTVTKPSGTVEGDLMFIHLMSQDTTPNITPPAGWTLLNSVTATSGATEEHASGLYYKIAGASEGASYVFTADASNYVWGACRITGHAATSTVATSTVNAATGATATGTAITPVNPNSLLLFFVSQSTSGGTGTMTASGYAVVTSNPTWTEVYDAGLQSRSIALAKAVRPEVTSTGSGTATCSGGSGTRGTVTHLVAVNRSYNITVPAAALTVAAVPTTAAISQEVVIPTATLAITPELPVITQADNAVTNVNKSSTSWNNQSKS